MKIEMISKIGSIIRGGNSTSINLDFAGKVQDTKLITAKDADMIATLNLKPTIADQIKFGSKVTITVSIEEPSEE